MDCNTIEEFMDVIKKMKTFRSSANKQYRLLKATKTLIQVRDERTKELHEFTPYALWAAYCELSEPERTVSNLRGYVGTNAAPSAAALLYASVGRGQVQTAINTLIGLMSKFK